MKTTHDLAIELLALPNIPILVEGWCQMKGYEVEAVLAEYDPENRAMLIQVPATSRDSDPRV